MSHWTENSSGLITCKNDLQLVIEDLTLAKIILGDFRGEGIFPAYALLCPTHMQALEPAVFSIWGALLACLSLLGPHPEIANVY